MRRAPRSSFVFAIGFSVAVSLGAGAAWAGDPSRDLGDIEPAASRDLDEVDTAEPEDSDGASAGAEAEDVVDSEDSDDAEARSGDMQEAASKPLGEADAEVPEWQPPPCEDVAIVLGASPAAKDIEAWRGALQDAESALDAARTRLAAADAEYTYARNKKYPRGAALEKIVASRDQARRDLAEARCILPARVRDAQRNGVPAEVWRDVPAAME